MTKNTLTRASKILGGSMILVIIILASFVYSDGTALSINIEKMEGSYLTTVTMQGQLVSDGMPVEGVRIGIMVDDSAGTHVFADEVSTNSSGHYITHLKLENTRTGSYTVYASASTTQAGSIISMKYFSIGECTEDWSCGSWSVCNSNSEQTRTCTDDNKCGTDEYKPDETRACTPSCSTLGGQVCTSSQICDGTYVDSSDSSYCCDGACRVQSTSTSSSASGGDTTSSSTKQTEDEEPEEEVEEEESPLEGRPNEKTNETMNETADSSVGNEEKTEEPEEEAVQATITGRFMSAVSDGRWIITDIILVILIIVLGRELTRKREKKGQYNFSPKGKRTHFPAGLLQFASIASFPHAGYGSRSRREYLTGSGVKKLKVKIEDDY